MKKIAVILSIILLGFLFEGCGGESSKNKKIKKEEEQYNITLLLDLSDRIDPNNKNLSQRGDYTRDMEILKKFVSFFKSDIEQKGGFKAKGRIRLICSPNPTDPNINKMLSELNIDLSKFNWQETAKKKEIYDKLEKVFPKNLKKIYQKTIQDRKYVGSDIWRFFKNDVKDYCVANESNYRNILVILTDGYLFHKDSKYKKGNRYSYILPEIFKANGLRKNNWQEIFKSGDYGLISTRKDLQDLEVLVLEVNPFKGNISDEELIKAYLEKWFIEMKVKKFAIYNTDLPVHTEARINRFLKLK